MRESTKHKVADKCHSLIGRDEEFQHARKIDDDLECRVEDQTANNPG